MLHLSRPSSPDYPVIAGVCLLTLLPAFTLLGHSGYFNGGYGVDVPDLMQYMGFIRDAGAHGLISNPFDVAASPHVFLDPVFAVSALAWRLGASIQFALLLWVPVVAVALLIGFGAYARRLLRAPGDRLIALVLAFFYLAPATALADWLHASPNLRFGTQVVGLEMFAGSYLWGGGPALAIALMPVCLLALERLLDPARRAAGRGGWWYGGWAGLSGLLTTWVHPWQGITLLLIMAGLAAWGRLRRAYLALVLPAALTAAPLVYYFVLSHTVASWTAVSKPNHYAHFGWWLWLGLAPVLLVLPGLLRRPLDLQERMLRLWPLAALIMYLALDRTWFYHALAGLSLPLAITAVKGWRPARIPTAVAVAAVVLVTAPGLVWVTQQLVRTRGAHFFTAGESRALAFMADSRRAGAVMAPVMPLGQAVPGFTGRRTYAGHYEWTPYYPLRAAFVDALFDGRLNRTQALRLVRASHVAFLASDCRRGRVDLSAELRGAIARAWRFGCARVYAVAP